VWTDSHCHIPHERVGEDTLAAARDAGVGRFITVGTDLQSSRDAVDVAARHDDVWAVAGIHPHDAKRAETELEGVVALLDRARVVAVGECGLDYHYDNSPRETQREVFAAQIAVAHERALPLVIHTRSAWSDTFDILDAERWPDRTIFHCFTGGPDEARRALDAGAVLSFSGIVTFPDAGDLRAAAALCPIDRLLVETDSPYLAPVPHRGKRNQPAFVPYVGLGVAAARGVPVEEIELATSTTADLVFSLS
jgi:TatD DNase family protein